MASAPTTHAAPITIDRINNLFYGNPAITPNLRSNGTEIFLSAAPLDGIHLNYDAGGYVAFYDGAGREVARINQAGEGDFAGGLTTAGEFTFGAAGSAVVRSNGTELYLSAAASDGVHLNFDSGGYVDFCDGAGVRVARINQAGEGDFSGGLSTALGINAGSASITGHLTANTADFTDLTAQSAIFETCDVAGSPVRTFANTPAAALPPAGIGVSTGTAWAASINPATLATWPSVGIAVSTGTAWGAAINPATLATWPAIGIPVSSGTAWAASIDPATLAHLNAANIFTADQTVTGKLTANDGEFAICDVAGSPVRTFANTPDTPDGMEWPAAGIGVSTGTAWAASINPATLATWPPVGVPVSTGTAWGASIAAANLARTNAVNTFAAAQTINGALTQTGTFALGLAAGPNVNNTGTTLHLDAGASDGILLNYAHGAGFVSFGNGAGAEVARINQVGTASFSGGVSCTTLNASGAVNFPGGLTVGAGAVVIGATTQLAAATNMNTVVKAGVYNSVNPSNSPAANYDFMFVVFTTDVAGYCSQMAWCNNSSANPTTYVRQQIGGAWTTWRQFTMSAATAPS